VGGKELKLKFIVSVLLTLWIYVVFLIDKIAVNMYNAAV